MKKLAGECADWLIHKNQNEDGTFKDSRKSGCVFEMSQAILSLLKFSDMENRPGAAQSAQRCGDWILKQQPRSRDKNLDGLWITPEYGKSLAMVSDTIESMWGILELHRFTQQKKYLLSSLRAFEAVKRARVRPGKLFISQHGIRSRVYLDYNFKTRRYALGMHRIIDDGIWYLLYKATGDRTLLREFKEQCDEQLRYQTDDGGFYETYYSTHHNVIMVAGARWSAYWATYPFFYAYDEFKDKKYLRVIELCCDWLVNRMEKDGSFYGWYYANGDVAWPHLDPNSPSVSIILWSKYMKLTGTKKYLPHCRKAWAWLLRNRESLRRTRPSAFAIQAYYDWKELVD